MKIKKVLKKLEDFEKKISKSVYLKVYMDGSCSINGFWSNDKIRGFSSLKELVKYLEKLEEVKNVNSKEL